jgi:hypothetical protein
VQPCADEAVDQTDEHAAAETGGDAECDVMRSGHRHAAHDTRERDVRADREIQIAADDHERRADRHDAEDRRLQENFGEVAGAEEVGRENRERDDEHEQDHRHEADVDPLRRRSPFEGELHAASTLARPVAIAVMRLSLAS